MCRPLVRPIVEISVAESDATARPSTRTFQTLSAGKTVQAGAPGRVGTSPDPGGGGGGGGGVVGGGGVGGVQPSGGWLDAESGFVPATYSRPSVQPSPSVSARRGSVRSFCSILFDSPSPSVFSRSSRMPSWSESSRSGCVPAFGSKPLRSPSWSGSSRSSRMPSRSLSARRGFVPSAHSWRFVRRSWSGSSLPSGSPSRSVSARVGLVRSSSSRRSWSGHRRRDPWTRRRRAPAGRPQAAAARSVTRTDRRVWVIGRWCRAAAGRDPPTGPGTGPVVRFPEAPRLNLLSGCRPSVLR